MLPRSNELIARIGGDEFCLVIPHFSGRQEVIHSAARLTYTGVNAHITGEPRLKV